MKIFMNFLLIMVFIILSSPASAVESFRVTAEVIAQVDITRDMPSYVKTNQAFDVNLRFYNLLEADLFNIIIRETIPAGYKIRNAQKTFPEPAYIEAENGATIIYWNIPRMANHTNLSLRYSLSAPKSAGDYTFGAVASGYDAYGNRLEAVNAAKQEVKVTKPSLLQNVLDFFQGLIT